ncbi:thymidylate kinase [Anabaena phage Elbi]|nr:thymidylate kinase [Anabaena phage Elbi]
MTEKPYTGTLIVFEGVDGAGKSTQADKAYDYLTGLKIPTVLTRQPKGTQFGQELAASIYRCNVSMTVRMQTLSMMIDRLEHVNSFIRPKLLEGYVVLCDRFTWSSIVYQGLQGVSREFIDCLNQMVTTDGVKIEPDLILVYHTELQTARNRMKKDDVFEKMDDTFYTEVIQRYKELGYYHDHSRVIDGALTPDSVWKITQKWLDKTLNLC